MTGRGVATAGIGDGAVVAVGGLRLGPPTPNPARGRLTVEIEGAQTGAVTLGIYDVVGRRVRIFLFPSGTSGYVSGSSGMGERPPVTRGSRRRLFAATEGRRGGCGAEGGAAAVILFIHHVV